MCVCDIFFSHDFEKKKKDQHSLIISSYKTTLIIEVCYQSKDNHVLIIQWNSMESWKIDSYIYGQLIFSKIER